MGTLIALLLLAGARSAAAASTATLVVCDDVQDPATLDPHKQFTEKNHTIVQQAYEGLLRFDENGRMEPALAVSWERVDPLRVRFKLRHGVTFHDGEPFDARAVVYSIARYVNPATGFPARAYIDSFARAVAIDSDTVDIVTKYPDGLLLNRLAGFVVMMAPDFISRYGEAALQERSAGTGPFRIERWDRGQDVVMSRNPGYWRAGFPKANQLVFRFIPWDRQVDELLAERVDILTSLPGTRTVDVARNPGTRLIKRETFVTQEIVLNAESGPFADKRVRLAVNYAVNRLDLLRYDALGNGRLLAALSMPGETGHDDSLRPYPYDPKKARRLLAEAGYGDRPLKIQVVVKEQGVRTAGIIQRQLEALGVEIAVRTIPDRDLVPMIRSQHWDMMIADCPDPMVHGFFVTGIILYSKSPFAIGRFPPFDRAAEDMMSTPDPEENARKERALDRLVHDEALAIPSYQRIKTYGVGRTVRFEPPVTGMPYFLAAGK